MGAFEYDGWRNAGVKSFFPAQCAQAPAVTGFQTGEPKFRAGRDEVVAAAHREVQKRLCHFGAHDMAALVVRIGVAATVPEVTGQGVKGAWNQ